MVGRRPWGRGVLDRRCWQRGSITNSFHWLDGSAEEAGEGPEERRPPATADITCGKPGAPRPRPIIGLSGRSMCHRAARLRFSATAGHRAEGGGLLRRRWKDGDRLPAAARGVAEASATPRGSRVLGPLRIPRCQPAPPPPARLIRSVYRAVRRYRPHQPAEARASVCFTRLSIISVRQDVDPLLLSRGGGHQGHCVISPTAARSRMALRRRQLGAIVLNGARVEACRGRKTFPRASGITLA